MDSRAEFVIPREKLAALRGTNRKHVQKVEKLFSCNVEVSNLGDPSGEWVTIRGQENDVKRGKDYILSLCDPEEETYVSYPSELHELLNGTALSEIEHASAAVIFLNNGEATVRGSSYAVTVAVSILESRIAAAETSRLQTVNHVTNAASPIAGSGFDLNEELRRALSRHDSDLADDEMSSLREDVKYMMVEQLARMEDSNAEDNLFETPSSGGSTDAGQTQEASTLPAAHIVSLPPPSGSQPFSASLDSSATPSSTMASSAAGSEAVAKANKTPRKTPLACNFVPPATRKGTPASQGTSKSYQSSNAPSTSAATKSGAAGVVDSKLTSAVGSPGQRSLWNAPINVSMSAFSAKTAESSTAVVGDNTSSSPYSSSLSSSSNDMSAALAALPAISAPPASSPATFTSSRVIPAPTANIARSAGTPAHTASHSAPHSTFPRKDLSHVYPAVSSDGLGSAAAIPYQTLLSSASNPQHSHFVHSQQHHPAPLRQARPNYLPDAPAHFSTTGDAGRRSHHRGQAIGNYQHGKSAPRGRRSSHERQRQNTKLLREVSKPLGSLRPIVIDGSNVAMSHGHGEVFSCRGIKIVVEFFESRGHGQITAFVPNFRQGHHSSEQPVTDQHILKELNRSQQLSFTPSRRVKGQLVVSYDDRFVLRYAQITGGVVVSNDQYRDLYREEPNWRPVIDRHLLPFTFVGDIFMPPDDPLGRNGPNLDQFLRF